MTTLTNAAFALERIGEMVSGRVIGPDHPDYDAARTLVYGGIDPRPAAIVRVAGADDIAAVIAYARETDTDLAVRSGGHSGAGHSSVDGGIVIDLRDLNRIEVEPEARTAWAESGATAGAVTKAAAEHGLAIGFGDTGTVGIGGITLGGGVGYLVRKHGLTIDNLLAAEIVTADGRTLLVDDEHDPDLFWALRGGGGNFGVVTRFKFRLVPLERIVGGMLFLPATAQTIADFMALAEAAPEELSIIANVMNCPPMPFVPEEYHGTLVIMGLVCYAGDAPDGERALAPFRALATPIADLVRPMTYPEMYPDEQGGEDYHPTAVSRNMFMKRVGLAEAETMVDRLTASDAPMRVVQLRPLGGAMARVAGDATAYAHRSAPIMVNVASFYVGDADKPGRRAWIDELCAALDQGEAGAYVNFVMDDEPELARTAYPGPTWERLASIKARYDPENVFRRNHNVPPAA